MVSLEPAGLSRTQLMVEMYVWHGHQALTVYLILVDRVNVHEIHLMRVALGLILCSADGHQLDVAQSVR
jgi:hypothetical protein